MSMSGVFTPRGIRPLRSIYANMTAPTSVRTIQGTRFAGGSTAIRMVAAIRACRIAISRKARPFFFPRERVRGDPAF